MKYIRQKHKLGCGSASLAMVMGISYDQALSLIHPLRPKYSKVCTDIIRIGSVLVNAGYKVEPKILTSLDDPRTVLDSRMAIMIVWMDEFYPWRHACAWDGKKVFDPMFRKGLGTEEFYMDHMVKAILVG